MFPRVRHQCLRSQGALGHTVGSRGSLPAALREHAEIIVGETGFCFANRFIFCYQICGYLFIKVKGSLPMTYQYRTVEMVNKTKTNSGFVDQKMFKTAGKYGFDSLYLHASMQVLDGYINHIRPLLRLICDFVLVRRKS